MTSLLRTAILSGLAFLASSCGTRPSAPAVAPMDASQERQVRVLTPQVLRMERYGFAILDFSAGRTDSGALHVLGEVRNNGTIPQGVELQVTLRDEDGQVVAERGFWPASLENIKPGEVRPFKFPLGRHGDIAQIELQITRVQPWD